MQRRRGAALLAGVLAALITSCAARSPAPPHWLPAIDQVASDPYGAWTEVSYSTRWHRLQVRGELVAVEPESLFVLSDSTLVAVPIAAYAYARVWTYARGGMAASARYAHRPLTTSKSGGFEQLRKYARFPDGFPPGLDRDTLRPRHPGR